MLESRGIVKPIAAPHDGCEWVVHRAAKSQIPYITDTHTKKWCMAVFQEQSQASDTRGTACEAPDLDLDNVDDDNASSGSKAVGAAAMRGLTPGGNLNTIF